MKTLIFGGGGRESALAKSLAQDTTLYAVVPHLNPSILAAVEKSGGAALIAAITDIPKILKFAIDNAIDLAFVNSDAALAAGVVDALLEHSIDAVGPTKAGAEVEWNKVYSMNLVQRVMPEYSPKFWTVTSIASLDSVFEEITLLDDFEVVVKPQGLTSGKGVKVQGVHLPTVESVKEYALQVLASDGNVILSEKLEGIEFTIQAITDGRTVLEVPASYDYPYRFDGDSGPGTGGMGAFTNDSKALPFLTDSEYAECIQIIERTLTALRDEGRHFNGVLNAGFFLTPGGIRVMEFNARFGDPECMNIMSILATSFSEVLRMIHTGSLSQDNVFFSAQASVVKYLVAPEYALTGGQIHEFELNTEALDKEGITVYFASSESVEGSGYRSVGTSRTVALAATADSISEASDLIDGGISRHVRGPLEYRKDIGAPSYIKMLEEQALKLRS